MHALSSNQPPPGGKMGFLLSRCHWCILNGSSLPSNDPYANFPVNANPVTAVVLQIKSLRFIIYYFEIINKTISYLSIPNIKIQHHRRNDCQPNKRISKTALLFTLIDWQR